MMFEIPVAGRAVLVLEFDAETPLLPLREPGPVAVVSDRRGGADGGDGHVVLRRSFRDLLRLDPALRALRPAHVVVHTLRNARPLPVAAAAALWGGATFHLVDGPGSAFEVNARGAVVRATELRLRRSIARLPGASGAALAAGFHLDPTSCWPRLRPTIELADEAAARAGGGPPAAGR